MQCVKIGGERVASAEVASEKRSDRSGTGSSRKEGILLRKAVR
jgi:hypothetical protein